MIPIEHHLLNRQVLALNFIHARHFLSQVKALTMCDVEPEVLPTQHDTFISLFAFENYVPVVWQKADPDSRSDDVHAFAAPLGRQLELA